MTYLQPELSQLRGAVLVCDCPLAVPCEADVSAGLVFEQTRGPSMHAGGRSGRRDSVVSPAASLVPKFGQEAVCQAVSKLFLEEVFRHFQVPMIEDLINAVPFTSYSTWLCEQDLAWDGA